MTWDLNSLYNSLKDPKILKDLTEMQHAVEVFKASWKEKFTISNLNNLTLIEIRNALVDYENFCAKFAPSKASVFASLYLETHQNDDDAKKLSKQVEEITLKVINELVFFTLGLAKLPVELQKQILETEEFEKWHHLLEKFFEEGKHTLSEAEERLLQLKSPTSSSNWIQLTEELLNKEKVETILESGKKEVVTLNTLLSLINSQNKEVRLEASKHINSIFEKFADVAVAEINSILQDKKIDDELRHYDRPDFVKFLEDDMEASVVDSLIKTVTDNFDIAHKYYEKKAKLMQLEKLDYYEKNVPIGNIDEKEFDFATSCEIVKTTFSNLDPEFANIFQSFLDEKRIDVYPKVGKGGGAFCTYPSPNLPIWVMLNHTNKFQDVTTIAHEMGHAINGKFMQDNYKDNILNYGGSLATAEVSSTFFEDFVVEELEKRMGDESLNCLPDKEGCHEVTGRLNNQLSFKMFRLNDDVSTIFRQVACYNFEKELHAEFRARNYLGKDEIGEIFKRNMKAYLGNAVDLDGYENWWVYWSHIRRFFYVYSYASGLLISKILQNKVRTNKQNINLIKIFLASGSDKSPRQIFEELGIDLKDSTTWEAGLAEIKKSIEEI